MFNKSKNHIKMEKYKLTKTIRFKGSPIHATEFIDKTLLYSDKKNEIGILNLITQGLNVINLFERLVFRDEEKKRLRGDVTIHFRWLRDYTKNEWYAWKESDDKKKEEQVTEKSKNKSNSPFAALEQFKDKLPDFIKEVSREMVYKNV